MDDQYVKKMQEIDGTVEAEGWFGVEFTDSTNLGSVFSLILIFSTTLETSMMLYYLWEYQRIVSSFQDV